MKRLAVVGARGRMGQTVVRLAGEQGIDVVCTIDAGDPITKLAKSGAEVAIDFSSPQATRALAEVASEAGIAIVSGTTGIGDDVRAALDLASQRVAVAWEPNMSIGVHVLSELVSRAIAMMGGEFDIEIIETHHKMKVDAPSGTALRLAEVASAARSGARLVNGREGKPGARGTSEIGMHAVRGGDVIGDHTAFFLGDGERLELTHRAGSRDLFAAGALRAAAWLASRPPGRYTMRDVLGL